VRSKVGARAIGIAVLVAVAAAGCSGGQSDLQKWIAETKKKPGGRVPALPEVKPYESFVYAASNLRSPFTPQGRTRPAPARACGECAPEPGVPRGLSLDTLRMVGTFKVGPHFYGLVQSKDGSCTRCSPATTSARTTAK